MSSLPSFRWPYGLTNDPTFALIADKLSPNSDIGEYRCSVADVVALYAAAAENAAREDSGGWFAFDLEAVAFRLGMGAELGREILDALIDRGRIERDVKDGGFFFVSWQLDHAMPENEADSTVICSPRGLLVPPGAFANQIDGESVREKSAAA